MSTASAGGRAVREALRSQARATSPPSCNTYVLRIEARDGATIILYDFAASAHALYGELSIRRGPRTVENDNDE